MDASDKRIINAQGKGYVIIDKKLLQILIHSHKQQDTLQRLYLSEFIRMKSTTSEVVH